MDEVTYRNLGYLFTTPAIEAVQFILDGMEANAKENLRQRVLNGTGGVAGCEKDVYLSVLVQCMRDELGQAKGMFDAESARRRHPAGQNQA